MSGGGDRHSIAQDAELITDPTALAEREARNGLRQFDEATRVIEDALASDRPFRLRPPLILNLNRTALDGLSQLAGTWRPADIKIQGSKHQPVGAHLVAERIEEMCDRVNDDWAEASPIHLSAYVMWRLNWIHPFADGNGRTSRALAHIVLCIRLGYSLPGTRTIPEQISSDKTPYYDALEAADEADVRGERDVGALEKLLSGMLAKQLHGVHEAATSQT